MADWIVGYLLDMPISLVENSWRHGQYTYFPTQADIDRELATQAAVAEGEAEIRVGLEPDVGSDSSDSDDSDDSSYTESQPEPEEEEPAPRGSNPPPAPERRSSGRPPAQCWSPWCARRWARLQQPGRHRRRCPA